MPDDLTANKKGVAIDLQWDTIKKGWKWTRSTIVTLALGAGGWHGWATETRLREIQSTLAECNDRLEQLEDKTGVERKPKMPGPNAGSHATGPPVIAPDTFRKIGK